MFTFSPQVTEKIKAYIRANNTTGKGKTRYLFDKGSMSMWVKKLLDSIGVPKDREGNINYLHKSYVSTAIQSFNGSAEERAQLAFHMKHSPSASIKYIRSLEGDPEMREAIKNISNIDYEIVKEVENLNYVDKRGGK